MIAFEPAEKYKNIQHVHFQMLTYYFRKEKDK